MSRILREPVLPAIVAAALHAGCTVGPDYLAPDLAAPQAWIGVSPDAPAELKAVRGELGAWWATLNDPVLDDLVARAIHGNLELQIAAARIREARADRAGESADFWPKIDLSGDYSYSGASLRSQADGSSEAGLGRQLASKALGAAAGAISGTGQAVDATPEGITTSMLNDLAGRVVQPGEQESSRGQHLFRSGFDASWEIDVFGGIRRRVEAAEADLAARTQAWRGVGVSLVAEVAVNYIELRGLQRRLGIARRNIAAQGNSLRLTQQRRGAGFANSLEVHQAEAQLETTRAQLPVLESQARQAVYRLGVLLGEPPGALVAELDEARALPLLPPEIPVGLPADLLRRRPDILEAERSLAAETARIGAATADLFPRFSLTGSFGTQTADMATFLDGRSLYWSFGPAIAWPIFQGGAIVASIEAQSAREQQALARYRLTVVTAFEEVESALAAYSGERTRRGNLAAAAEANAYAVDASTRLYAQGLTDFLNVLESQRSLYSTQDALAQSEIDALTNLVALYKALGGGWNSPAPMPAAGGG